jgi:hypothetical protein
VKRLGWLWLTLAIAVACATREAPKPVPPPAAIRAPQRTPTRAPQVEIFFRGEQPFARRGSEEWSLGDVTKSEMVFSPDGQRFAYVRLKPAPPNQPPAKAPPARVLVRNLAGDPVNEFAAFRPGMPDSLSWVDNRRLSYVAAPDPASSPPRSGKPLPMYVLHDADTGEVLAARPGTDFVWDARHRHVAFTSGSGAKQALVVDGQNVWPRSGVTRLHGLPVWSNDGHGIALVDEGGVQPHLVVLVEYLDPQGDLTWPIPREALAPGLKIFWAGDSKVIIGESAFKPKFATGWERLQ